MKAKLVFFKDGMEELVFPVLSQRTTIGRDSDNSIQVPNPNVSKHHATITQDGIYWKIEDNDSRNGLSVNGEKVSSSALNSGDTIKLGPIELSFQVPQEGESWTPDHIIDLSPDAIAKTLENF